MPELDRFEEEGIDDNGDMSDLSMSERMAAEREMRKRDREEMAATGRMRHGLLYGLCQRVYIMNTNLPGHCYAFFRWIYL